MIRPPSNQRQYDDFFSGDPAFVQPPEAPPEGADSKAVAEYEEAAKDHWRKVEIARETGDWSALLIEGAQPTKFQMEPIKASAFAVLADMAATGGNRAEVAVLAFRLALRGVANFGKAEVRFEQSKRFGRLAITDFFDKQGLPAALSLRIMQELGGAAIERASRLSPKS